MSNQPPPPEDIYMTFAGQINPDTVRSFFGVLTAASRDHPKRVHLLMHSTGGFINDGIALYHFLDGLPFELITYNAGLVASIAVLPYLAGKVRKASKEASFLIHKATFEFRGAVTAETIGLRAESIKREDGMIEDILRSYIKMPDDKWLIHASRDLFVSAEEAVEFAFVHKIENWKVPQGEIIWSI